MYTDRLIIWCRTDIVRARSVIAIAFILACPTAVMAQGDPGPNRNLIGLTPDPADIRDTNARQQNEPSCAVRPGNSACIICGYNDYRTVDLFGDGWQGVSQSCDTGYSWLSRVAPGHPNHIAPINAEFAADPSMIAIDGMAIFNFIAGYRDSNVGVVAVQHWLEVNKEDADHYEPGLNTYIVADGSEGRFLDKTDALAVLDPASEQGTINLSTEMENTALGTINRSFPTGTLYVAFAVFTGDHGVKVYYKTSRNWGQSWINQAKKLSEGQNLVSGISLTNIGDTVLAVWRRAGDGNKKLYASGSLPFLGDYITVAGEEYRLRDDGKSESNSSPIISPALDKTPFFIAWTDNRDVRGSVAMIDDPLPYSPPDIDLPQMTKRLSIGKLGDEAEVMLAATPEPFERAGERTGPPADRSKTAEGLDGADMNPQACVPGSGAYDRSRDSNIYGSVIEDQVRLYAPTISSAATYDIATGIQAMKYCSSESSRSDPCFRAASKSPAYIA